jgi:hypothetical protein
VIDQLEEVFTLVDDEAARLHFLHSITPRSWPTRHGSATTTS